MSAAEKFAKRKELNSRLKKSGFKTVFNIYCALATQAKQPPFISEYYGEINYN